MILPKMKPGERVLVELRCIEDREGRVSVTVDVVEKMPAKRKPNQRQRPLTRTAAIG